jgi:inorganic pyrophosphatase
MACNSFKNNEMNNPSEIAQTSEKENKDSINLLHDVQAFTLDNELQAVVEIPAGTHAKFEVNKITGIPEQQVITGDSLREINYIPYPANYGFVPRSILRKEEGGDGDPLDIFILGKSVARGTVLKVKVLGVIKLLDKNEQDDKLISVDINGFMGGLESLDQLKNEYPGVIEILTIWLTNYKREGGVQILSIEGKDKAMQIVDLATQSYQKSH